MNRVITNRNAAGFSLIEVLVAMVLVGIIGIVASNVLTQGARQSQRMAEEFDMRSSGLEVLRELEVGWMDAGVRRPGLISAAQVAVNNIAGGLEVSYTDEVNDMVKVTYADGTLRRTFGATGTAGVTILEDVSEFSVCKQPTAGPNAVPTIAIDLKLRRAGNPERRVDLGTELYIRNATSSGLAIAEC